MTNAMSSLISSQRPVARAISRVPIAPPAALATAITARKPGGSDAGSMRPSTEISAREAETNTAYPSCASTIWASAGASMQLSAPGRRTQLRAAVRPVSAREGEAASAQETKSIAAARAPRRAGFPKTEERASLRIGPS
jgi:hypothetical protein